MRPQNDLRKTTVRSMPIMLKKRLTSSSGRLYNRGMTSGPISRKTTTLILWSVLTWDAMDVSRSVVRDDTDGDNPGDDIVVREKDTEEGFVGDFKFDDEFTASSHTSLAPGMRRYLSWRPGWRDDPARRTGTVVVLTPALPSSHSLAGSS